MSTCPRCGETFVSGTTRIAKALCAVCAGTLVGTLTQSGCTRTDCWCGHVPGFVADAANHPISNPAVRRICELAAQMHSGYNEPREDNQNSLTTAQLVARIKAGQHSYTACGGIAMATISMLNEIGQTARLFSTTSKTEHRGHQQLEWWDGDKWVYIDIYSDFVPVTMDGESMTMYEFVQAVNAGTEWTTVPLSATSWDTLQNRVQKVKDICQVPIIYEGTLGAWGYGRYPAGSVTQAWYDYWITQAGASWRSTADATWMETFYPEVE